MEEIKRVPIWSFLQSGSMRWLSCVTAAPGGRSVVVRSGYGVVRRSWRFQQHRITELFAVVLTVGFIGIGAVVLAAGSGSSTEGVATGLVLCFQRGWYYVFRGFCDDESFTSREVDCWEKVKIWW
ncbi:uncharacterized protein LOC131628674 [Vicia villosa]|uniref:uncharacterized protein LOC131595080 n=1 Tax=Vicia villosa TaxID=3911 RepID=UPI00273CF23A|nr:uncharacterized protein LOC131595080 [Vicia villosa]XP_058755485.1 uncharacterized protein LOC131628674 [Vicia villosa]